MIRSQPFMVAPNSGQPVSRAEWRGPVLSLQKKESVEQKIVYVAPIGTDQSISLSAQHHRWLRKFRRAGIPAQSEISGRSPSQDTRDSVSLMRDQGSSDFVNQKSFSESSAKVKWLSTGEEVVAKISELASLLK